MTKTLVIVESPGKIKKLSLIFGSDYIVKASVGHIRGLHKEKYAPFGFDIDNDFKPYYQSLGKQRSVINDLKSYVNKCDDVIIATDDDREGEGIALALKEELNLTNPKRIIFRAITKADIKKALANPGVIDMNQANAQKARQILDKLVGYKLSPVLWKYIANGLSAGRVQSPALRLTAEREHKIRNFESKKEFRVTGQFKCNKQKYRGILMKNNEVAKIEKSEKIKSLLTKFIESQFEVIDVKSNDTTRNPAPPFITSSLQQDASAKYRFDAKRTMSIAQKLYEKGYITYMRTDSTMLSKEALASISNHVKEHYGEEYYQFRTYTKNKKNAQEAHEAIRPTKINKIVAGDTTDEKKLYDLIWKRTVASQMASAKINIVHIHTGVFRNNKRYKEDMFFDSKIEKILFDGYLKVYEKVKHETEEEEDVLHPDTKIPEIGDIFKRQVIEAVQQFTKPQARYNDATLIRELEKKGIGRPSTYAGIMDNLLKKSYLERRNVDGEKKNIEMYSLRDDKIKLTNKKIVVGSEKRKLVPTELGLTVSKFLEENFTEFVDYDFTAKMENSLDKVAKGKKDWVKVVRKINNKLDPLIETVKKTNKKIKIEKTNYGNGEFPKDIGEYEDNMIQLCKGKYGVYLKWNDKNYGTKMDKDEIDIEKAVEIIKNKNKSVSENIVKVVKDGKCTYTIRKPKQEGWSHYIIYDQGLKNKKAQFKTIPNKYEPSNLTLEQIQEICGRSSNKNTKQASKYEKGTKNKEKYEKKSSKKKK